MLRSPQQVVGMGGRGMSLRLSRYPSSLDWLFFWNWLREVARAKKSTAGGLEKWAWNEVKALLLPLFSGLTFLLELVETTGDWPQGPFWIALWVGWACLTGFEGLIFPIIVRFVSCLSSLLVLGSLGVGMVVFPRVVL